MSENKAFDTVTADDVAQLAGVSRWTVHRAFKTDASISAKSRDKVMQAAEALGYVPDLLAVSLASDRSGLVAILIDDFSNPQQTVMMSLVSDALRRAGWHTLLVSTPDETDAATALLHASQHRVDAAVLIGGRFNDKELSLAHGAQRMRKLISFGRLSQNHNTVAICCDNVAAMTEMTDYVVSRGYSRPLFVAGPKTLSAHVLRKEAVLARWAQLQGIKPDVLEADTYNPELSFARIAEYLMALPKEGLPDVIMCENDALALGAMDAVRHKLGMRVPDDIAVTGFDDMPFAGNLNYDITTYRQPNAAMADAVVAVLHGATDTADFARMTGTLIKRSSC